MSQLTSSPRKVWVVVPCYNEEERLDYAAFLSFINVRRDWTFLFVDDGSSDDTARALEELVEAATHGNAGLMANASNAGKGESVRRGIKRAFEEGAEAAGFLDADLSAPASSMDRLVETLRNYPSAEIATGARVQMLGRGIERHWFRHYPGRVFATVASELVMGLNFYDTQCGAKLFRSTPRVRRIWSRPFIADWIFDVEVVLRFQASPRSSEEEKAPDGTALPAEDAIREVPLQEWRDVPGSKIGVKGFARAAFDLAKLWWFYK